MSMFEFRVIPDDPAVEPFDLTAGMRDVRIWEKTHPRRGMGMLQDAAGVKAEVLFEIAFSACRRQKLIPAEMTEESFIDAHEIDIETPGEKAARKKAERLRDEILTAGEPEIPGDEEDAGLDPTPAGASPAE